VGSAAAAFGLGTVALTGMGGGGGGPVQVHLSGAKEVTATGAPGNPHGNADRGTMTLRFNPGLGKVCWRVTSLTLTRGETLPTAAHIHAGAVGVAGPVVVGLFGGTAPVPAPTSYPTRFTCETADRATVQAIVAHPSSFYVNLHNAAHPGGALRGQLHR